MSGRLHETQLQDMLRHVRNSLGEIPVEEKGQRARTQLSEHPAVRACVQECGKEEHQVAVSRLQGGDRFAGCLRGVCPKGLCVGSPLVLGVP